MAINVAPDLEVVPLKRAQLQVPQLQHQSVRAPMVKTIVRRVIATGP